MQNSLQVNLKKQILFFIEVSKNLKTNYRNFVSTRSFTKARFEKYVRDLLLFKGKKVEVWEKKTKEKNYSKILWVSFEDLFTSRDHLVIIKCLKELFLMMNVKLQALHQL